MHISKAALYKLDESSLKKKLASNEIPMFIPKIIHNPVPLVQPRPYNYGVSNFVLVNAPINDLMVRKCDLCEKSRKTVHLIWQNTRNKSIRKGVFSM